MKDTRWHKRIRSSRTGEADAVAFGQLFIANPDLPARFTQQCIAQCAGPKHFFHTGAAWLYRLPCSECVAEESTHSWSSGSAGILDKSRSTQTRSPDE